MPSSVIATGICARPASQHFAHRVSEQQSVPARITGVAADGRESAAELASCGAGAGRPCGGAAASQSNSVDDGCALVMSMRTGPGRP
jgi:hypothetical protein